MAPGAGTGKGMYKGSASGGNVWTTAVERWDGLTDAQWDAMKKKLDVAVDNELAHNSEEGKSAESQHLPPVEKPALPVDGNVWKTTVERWDGLTDAQWDAMKEKLDAAVDNELAHNGEEGKGAGKGMPSAASGGNALTTTDVQRDAIWDAFVRWHDSDP